MPTYGYRCPKCGHEYDKFQKITDNTRAKCPKCGTRGERLISGGSGVLFKGTGFYETDYKRAGKKSGDEGGKSEASKSETKTEKPAEKSSEKSTTSSEKSKK